MDRKRLRLSFGTYFLAMTTAAALLLTWTLWWILVVGSSVPARRPFYQVQSGIPKLILEASSNTAANDIFQYSLPGGWPSVNSGLRLVASVAAVLASFSFAFVATLASDTVTRAYFAAVLSCVTVFSFAAFVADAVSIASTSKECKVRRCVTAVPEVVRLSGNVCKCSPDGWFYLTLVVDLMLCFSALACLIITLTRSLLSRRQRRARPVSSSTLATDPPTIN